MDNNQNDVQDEERNVSNISFKKESNQEIKESANIDSLSDIEIEEEKPNRPADKKLTVKKSEKNLNIVSPNPPEDNHNIQVDEEHIIVEIESPSPEPVDKSQCIYKKTDAFVDESHLLKSIGNEFDNMLLDVDKELLVNENEYIGNIDLSNKEETRKV